MLNNFDLIAAARRWPVRTMGERFTLLTLVTYMGMNEDGEWTSWPGVNRLAEETLQSPASVYRHLAAFGRAGLITTRRRVAAAGRGRRTNELVLHVEVLTNLSRREGETLDQPLTEPSTNLSPGAPRTSYRTTKELPTTCASASPPPEVLGSRQAAELLVRTYWESCDPRPATSFIALVKITERFLLGGHEPTSVTWALENSRAHTIAAMTFALNERKAPRRSNVSNGIDAISKVLL